MCRELQKLMGYIHGTRSEMWRIYELSIYELYSLSVGKTGRNFTSLSVIFAYVYEFMSYTLGARSETWKNFISS